MVKTLRITSFILAAAALGGVGLLVVWGMKGNPEIQEFLVQKGVVERLKNQPQTAVVTDDAVSPLVTQAQKFALRIDPPPAPVVVSPVPPTPRTTPTSTPTATQTPVGPPIPVTPTGRFTLVATARSADFPERSLALFRPVVGVPKWYRQGENLAHLVIHEIRDGSVVLYQNGILNSEQFVPKPAVQGKPLLKSDTAVTAGTSGPGGVTASAATAPAATATAAGAAGSTRLVREATRAPIVRPVSAGSRIRQASSLQEPPQEVSREEQKESIRQSIAGISEILSMTSADIPEEEQKKEQELWIQLMEVLQKEQAALEAAEPNSAPPGGTAEAVQGEPQN